MNFKKIAAGTMVTLLLFGGSFASYQLSRPTELSAKTEATSTEAESTMASSEAVIKDLPAGVAEGVVEIEQPIVEVPAIVEPPTIDDSVNEAVISEETLVTEEVSEVPESTEESVVNDSESTEESLDSTSESTLDSTEESSAESSTENSEMPNSDPAPEVEESVEVVEEVPSQKPVETPAAEQSVSQKPLSEEDKQVMQEAQPPISNTEVETNYQYSVSRNQTTAEFIQAIGQDAQTIAWEADLYASVMIAQAILETGSGNSQLSRPPNYNLFGIKGSYQGATVNFATQEDNGSGSLYTIRSGFRKYPSYKESLQDYAVLLKGGISGNSRFYQATWKSHAPTYQAATAFLTGRYATDTNYDKKLNALIETYELTQFDREPNAEEVLEADSVPGEETESVITSDPEVKNDLPYGPERMRRYYDGNVFDRDWLKDDLLKLPAPKKVQDLLSQPAKKILGNTKISEKLN